MVDRRSILKSGLAYALCSCACRASAQPTPIARSCITFDASFPELSLESGASPSDGDDLDGTSGSSDLDAGISNLANSISNAFNIRPSVRFIKSGRIDNAFATNKIVVLGTQGTVSLGNKLIKTAYGDGIGANTLACILAHEFAHVSQLSQISTYMSLCKQKPILGFELTADFIAGWYIGRLGLLSAHEANEMAMAMFIKGDFFKGSAQFHGEPSHRYTMTMKGYAFGSLRGALAAMKLSESLSVAFKEAKLALPSVIGDALCS